MSKKGPIQHSDLWEVLLSLTKAAGCQVKWLHTPSHIDNTRADHLADVGRKQSPLLFGHISAHPRRQEVQEEVELDDEMDAAWEWEPSEEEKDIDPDPLSGRRPHAENPRDRRQERGHKQVSKRSTHARPGVHMQQCSAVRQDHRYDTSVLPYNCLHLLGLYFVNTWVFPSYSTDWAPYGCHPLPSHSSAERPGVGLHLRGGVRSVDVV